VLIVVAVATVVASFVALRNPGEGPIYKGRHLSEWVGVQGRAIYSGSSSDYDDSAAAIREAGTNAFPLLLKWMQHEDSNLRHWLIRPFRRSLSERQFFNLIMGPAVARAEGAAEGIRVLRANTPPEVVLELAVMLNNFQKPQTASRAARALGSLGSRGKEPLLLVLQQPQHPARFFAVVSLHQLHGHQELNPPPKILLPALIEFTTQTNVALTGVPAFARNFLSELNVTPDQYVSALTNLLSDPDVTVRAATTNALRRIAPEALTNAPPR
jgi:hypothetical protein